MASRRRGGSGGGRRPRSQRRQRPPRAPRPRRQRSDLADRIIWAIPAIVFAIVIVTVGEWAFVAGLVILGLACMHELFSMTEGARPVKVAGFIGVIALAVTAHVGDPFHLVLVLVALVPVVYAFGLAAPERSGITISMAVTFLGITWIGLAIAHAILLRDLPHGGAIVVDVLVGTFIGDTGAYLGGRAFGQRKLAPRLSPNKTVEGLAIGMFAAIMATWFAGLYQDWLSGTDALLIGLAVAISAPAGDLFESTIKRDAGVKDTGRLFGPHGGALDRLDAVLFSIVAAYYVWVALL
jgi:phosphatidate cytidylyltransferase